MYISISSHDLKVTKAVDIAFTGHLVFLFSHIINIHIYNTFTYTYIQRKIKGNFAQIAQPDSHFEKYFFSFACFTVIYTCLYL
ncbi:hypothetical protein TSAR_005970 [Trichomalopsis sarcophagae]|uniref:Uncharacterized protein n=1 Tax=Trichomalopsis sarcophagae TaxID=543379 RepID=A0A232EVU7_9HYME|nr:hypothetical protein TSAR_005970 [Trichomalopsis sarcophagae]